MDTPTNMPESQVSGSDATPDSHVSETKKEGETEPRSPKIDSERSIFDVDFSKLGVLEPITKAVTITAIISYAAGFLIIVINEGRLGFLDASLLKPRAVIVGVVALLLIILPITLTRGVFIRPRSDEEESDEQLLARIGLSLTDFLTRCGAAWVFASFVFVSSGSGSLITVQDGTVVRHNLQFAGWMISVAVVVTNGLLAYPNDRRAYWKAPRFWICYSALWVALIAFAAFTQWRTGSAVYFAWSLVSSIFFHSYENEWRHGLIRSFKLPAVLFWSLSVLSLYATFLFPRINSNWGGGTPIPALFTIASATGSKPSEELRVNLVEATDSGYYVTVDGQRNIAYIPKSSVQAIEFTTQTGR